jgi:hypothetical protein
LNQKFVRISDICRKEENFSLETDLFGNKKSMKFHVDRIKSLVGLKRDKGELKKRVLADLLNEGIIN